jgi:hypothetical protein
MNIRSCLPFVNINPTLDNTNGTERGGEGPGVLIAKQSFDARKAKKTNKGRSRCL